MASLDQVWACCRLNVLANLPMIHFDILDISPVESEGLVLENKQVLVIF